MNRIQQCLVKAYAEGDFSYVKTADEAKEVGDGLFHFLFIELSGDEGCDSKHEALRLLDTIRTQLDELVTVLENCPDDLSDAA